MGEVAEIITSFIGGANGVSGGPGVFSSCGDRNGSSSFGGSAGAITGGTGGAIIIVLCVG